MPLIFGITKLVTFTGKGWGAILRRDSRLEKDTILHQIQELDVIADGVGLNDEGWMRRYHLEETLVNIY
jgi:hypothetical protein